MQTDFSKLVQEHPLLQPYEEYAQGIERLNKTLQNELDACHRYIDSLMQDIQHYRTDADEQGGKLRQLEGQHFMALDLEGAMGRVQTGLKQLTKLLKEHLAEVQQNKEINWQDVEEQQKQRFSRVQRQLQRLITHLKTSCGSLRKCQTEEKMLEMIGQVQILVDRSTQLNFKSHNETSLTDLPTSRSEIDTLFDKIIDLEKERQGLLNQIEIGDKMLRESQRTVTDLEKRLEEESTRVQQLNSQLQIAETTIDEMRQHLCNLQSDDGSKASSSRQIRHISDQDIEEKEEMLQRLEDQYRQKQQLYAFIEQLKATIADLNTSMEKNRSNSSLNDGRTKQQINRLMGEIRQLTKENVQLKEINGKLQKKRVQWEIDLHKLRKEKQAETKKVLETKQMWLDEEAKLKTARKQIDRLRRQAHTGHNFNKLLSPKQQHISHDDTRLSYQLKPFPSKMSHNLTQRLTTVSSTEPNATNPEQPSEKENTLTESEASQNIDSGHWSRLQDKLRARKQYTETLDKNISFRLLKLRN